MRSLPEEAEIHCDGRFVGMTGRGEEFVSLVLESGVHEFCVSRPGANDRVWRQALAANEDLRLLVRLDARGTPSSRPDFVPLVAKGQLVRATLSPSDAGPRYFRFLGQSGERRLLVLHTPGVVPRLLDAKGREIAFEVVPAVQPMRGFAFLEFSLPEDGQAGLEVVAADLEKTLELTFRMTVPPPPFADPVEGQEPRRRPPTGR